MYEPKTTHPSAILLNEAVSLFLLLTSPLFCLFYWIAYQDFDASLTTAAANLISEGLLSFFFTRVPFPSLWSTIAYLLWVILQTVLFIYVPGPVHLAPRTPGGRRLLYKLNGFLAWLVTLVVAVTAACLQLLDPAAIANHWGELLSTASAYSAVLIAVFHVKARFWPDNTGDTLLTGNFFYDIFNGGELHPRTGEMFDWKHFNASRTGGILLWTLIDLSFAALQWQRYGYVTNSMVLATMFRMIIVGEYFYIENWFFETLDGAHERFSFYSIFGFAVMMPQIWTLQTQYLALHPIELSNSAVIAVIGCFIAGWALNHDANNQKSSSRQTGGNCKIWGQDARVLEATYQTADGKTHRTVLLCSGWWGRVRHANYVGSCLYTWAPCVACGGNHLFPYAEAVIVTMMIMHRCYRDEARCKEKYGETWDKYCRMVRWRMIPGVF